ncbi:hypothetical protein [Streptomyces sp. NBC_01373]|uniref:hypothetical protein n=1 Tax=Streptomyces sp. NBC_01373 TaxID=2903843 RepID=UPI00225147E8|nr:hypothetical protein [Streptomyces sp. NBC_01373]MCX4699529.1 hypothetical protein [Streptomyces sp. NBC_01373]
MGGDVDETGDWARLELVHLTGLPAYGSSEWHLMEPSDPRRQAALIVAAEAWRTSQGGI